MLRLSLFVAGVWSATVTATVDPKRVAYDAAVTDAKTAIKKANLIDNVVIFDSVRDVNAAPSTTVGNIDPSILDQMEDVLMCDMVGALLTRAEIRDAVEKKVRNLWRNDAPAYVTKLSQNVAVAAVTKTLLERLVDAWDQTRLTIDGSTPVAGRQDTSKHSPVPAPLYNRKTWKANALNEGVVQADWTYVAEPHPIQRLENNARDEWTWRDQTKVGAAGGNLRGLPAGGRFQKILNP